MLLASGEVSFKHPGAPSFLGEGDSSGGLAPSVTPLTPSLPLQQQQQQQQQQPCNCWPYVAEQPATGGVPVGSAACRAPGGSPLEPPAGALPGGPLQLPVAAGSPSCLGVEGSRLTSPVAAPPVDGAAATGGPPGSSPPVWVSGGTCNRGPSMPTSCPSPCTPAASYQPCHVSCLGKPLQQSPLPCYPSLLMGASLGPAGQVMQQHQRSSPQGPLMSQQPPQHSVLLQQQLVQQQHLVQQPVLQPQLLQQPGGSLSLCVRPEAVNMITVALRRYLAAVVSEVYRDVGSPWQSSSSCCSQQLQQLPLCRKDHEGGSSPIGTSSTATTSGGLEEEEDSAFSTSGSNSSNIAGPSTSSSSSSSSSRCGETTQSTLALPKGLSSDDSPAAPRPTTAANAANAAAAGGDEGSPEVGWSLLCKKETYYGNASSGAASAGAAGAGGAAAGSAAGAAAAQAATASSGGEQAFHLHAIRNGPSEHLAKYVVVLLPFLSDSPQELRARNPQCFVDIRMQLEALHVRLQEQQQYQQQLPLQPQHHQHQMAVQHQPLPMQQQAQHPQISLQQQQQQPMALQQQPHQQQIALQQHRQMPLQQQPEMRLHHPQQLPLQQQPQQDVCMDQPQQISLQQQQLPTLLQQQQQLTRATSLPAAPTGFAAGCCSTLREATVAGSAAGGAAAGTAAAGFNGADGSYGGPIVPHGWQGVDAAAGGDGVRGEVRGRPSWPVDESLRWGPPASSDCPGGAPYGFMGAPGAGATKGECGGSCSSSGTDTAALVQLPRGALPPSLSGSGAGEAANAAAAAAGDCMVPRMGLGTVGSCSHDELNSPGRLMMPWGSRGGLPRPAPPPLGPLVALDSAAAAGASPPGCMWSISSPASAAVAPNSLVAAPGAAAAQTGLAAVGLLPLRKKLVPAELGSVISAEGLGRSPRGNVRVCHSQPHNAWLVLCCAGGVESRAFSVLQLGYEGAKRVALLYAAQCRRHLNSRRAAAQKPPVGLGGVGEVTPDRSSKVKGSEEASAELAATGLGSTGPPGGCFNLIDCSGDVPYTTRSDVSASRVARLSRRAMELPYVHGVRFEAETFAWVAQMRGEARRFLVKKHGFIKSRLCAVEKIQAWRATLPPAALEQELKVEQEVLEMLRAPGANPAALAQPMPLGPPLQPLPAPDFRETSASLDF
ncbi:hypothetical protein, conserved [Eimeria brunetti]|uniref:Uncharacterized protein n=1 Tax=Eimeria brunetti TaxID=51314 RepID=U6LVP1_9EIME|nr:hypothetical protein, conserved [Eimeria brunetti]